MKVVAFSINPLFPGKVMGGAPKHLQNIVIHLGENGHDVVVLCAWREDTPEPFHWHGRVQVLPILQFKQPFPQPYAVPAYQIANIIQDVGEHLQAADRFYMHDGEFLFPYGYQHVPTVVSLRDNVYPETLLGGFLFQGHRLIVISAYARDYFLQTVGRFFPDMAERIQVIHNGLDWERFQPTPPRRILEMIPINPAQDVIVLHPHRPESSKGIRETIAVVDLLVNEYGIQNLKTLVPRWLDLKLSPDLRQFYDEIQQEIHDRGLDENFVFHEWVPQELMPEYYSLGRVTLALGHFVESFGNAVYESFGCGTPAVASRISSHRELLPEHLAYKVDYGDIQGAAALAAAIIQENRRTSPQTLAYLHTHYGVQQQLEQYAHAILGAQLVEPLRYQLQPITAHTRFQLPVWCYRAERGIYHDFLARFRSLAALNALLDRYPDGFTWLDAAQAGISQAEMMAWYREGYLYPALEASSG